MIALGNFTISVCSGVLGNLLTEPCFRWYTAWSARAGARSPVEATDLRDEPAVEVFDIVSRVFAEILYHRGILGKEDFIESHSTTLDVTTKVMRARSEPAEKLVFILDRGIFTALHRGKAMTLEAIFYMGTGRLRQPVEKYTFEFSFGEKQVDGGQIEVHAEEFNLMNLLENLKGHVKKNLVKRKKASWTVVLQLLTLEAGEEAIPFFSVGSAVLASFGSEELIGEISSTKWSYSLMVATCAPERASPSEAPQIYLAEVEI